MGFSFSLQVEWKHANGQRPSTLPNSRLSSSLVGNKAVLRIRHVKETDYGVYECSASNNEGTAEGKIELTG